MALDFAGPDSYLVVAVCPSDHRTKQKIFASGNDVRRHSDGSDGMSILRGKRRSERLDYLSPDGPRRVEPGFLPSFRVNRPNVMTKRYWNLEIWSVGWVLHEPRAQCAWRCVLQTEESASLKPNDYRTYLLVLLAVIYAFNFMDMGAFGMALQSIKVSLHLSDAQLGLVSGVAFSVFYSTVGVGLGRWADVGNRVTILSVTRIIWGVMVILTGRARSFMQMFAVRMGVAVGESGCLPPAYSLIGEYFSRAERPRALGIFFLGIPLSMLLGFFVSGWLIQHCGWRETFTIMGLPGFALALVVWLTLKEPRRRRRENVPEYKARAAVRQMSDIDAPDSALLSLWETFKHLYANATFRRVLLAFVVSYFFFYGAYQWQAAFFIRSYGMQTGTLGAWLAVAYGVPGVIGNYLGGVMVSRWATGNERLQLIIMAVLYCISGVVLPFVYLTHDAHAAFALIAISTLAFQLGNPAVVGSLQAVVPARMRAISIMIVFLFANLIGLGLGPVLTGVLSQALQHTFGVDSLRYALALMSPWFFVCGWLVWRGSKTAARDVEVARRTEDGLEEAIMS